MVQVVTVLKLYPRPRRSSSHVSYFIRRCGKAGRASDGDDVRRRLYGYAEVDELDGDPQERS